MNETNSVSNSSAPVINPKKMNKQARDSIEKDSIVNTDLKMSEQNISDLRSVSEANINDIMISMNYKMFHKFLGRKLVKNHSCISDSKGVPVSYTLLLKLA